MLKSRLEQKEGVPLSQMNISTQFLQIPISTNTPIKNAACSVSTPGNDLYLNNLFNNANNDDNINNSINNITIPTMQTQNVLGDTMVTVDGSDEGKKQNSPPRLYFLIFLFIFLI
jgi:hypothetical protein